MTTDKTPADAVREALESLSLLSNFAYENGYHELGYSPETVIRDHIAALTARVAELDQDSARLAKLRKRAKQSTAYDVYGPGGHWSIGFFSIDNRLSFDDALDAMQEPQP